MTEEARSPMDVPEDDPAYVKRDENGFPEGIHKSTMRSIANLADALNLNGVQVIHAYEDEPIEAAIIRMGAEKIRALDVVLSLAVGVAIGEPGEEPPDSGEEAKFVPEVRGAIQ